MITKGDPTIKRVRKQAHLSRYEDIERMSGAARRRYLQRRLNEIERMIEYILWQRLEESSAFASWDATTGHRELWEDIMDLNYLEASRRAILQTLADLNSSTTSPALD